MSGEVSQRFEQANAVATSASDSLAEVLRKLCDDASCKPTDATSGTSKTQLNADSIELVNHGQVKHMVLPPKWEEGTAEYGTVGNSSFRQFHPPGDPDVRLCFYFRGRRMGDDAAQQFRAILDKPPHALTQSEIKSLGELLRDKKRTEDFSMLGARTVDMNGKRVLVVEGRYNKIQEDTQEIFVDSDRTGKFVQEIFYQAPRASYPRYLKMARTALNSIEWQ